ncbi:MAG: DUF924 family protein [Pseudomonadota bacterium]|nr:DUF924 family protein [Pseudomonadota bacterium]
MKEQTNPQQYTADNILNYWFEELTATQWFEQDTTLDWDIAKRFSDVHFHAAQLDFLHWRESAQGRLAEILILDQFSRHIYRGTPLSFAFDGSALALAQEAVAIHALEELEQALRNFLLMPFMHSESLWIHQVAEPLFVQYADEQTCSYAWKHREVIEQFGRYPHRNAVLDRETTADERVYLAAHPGF